MVEEGGVRENGSADGAAARSVARDAQVASGYRFAPVADPEALRTRLEARAGELALLGTVLVAEEGVNLSLVGTAAALDAFEATLALEPGFADFRGRRSPAFERQPFRRLKVRCRGEIVTLGRPQDRFEHEGAQRVDPQDWHRLLDDPTVTVIDVRNDFEVEAGTFPGSLDPHTSGFREFPDWVDAHLQPDRTGTIAMFCTGGIRCEKVAAWMRGRGFEDVRELDGGILAYLEAVPPEQSRWQGDCFVFDDRVSLREGLSPGELDLCHGCLRPLTLAATRSNAYEPGVSCPLCIDALTPEERRLRRERRRQATADTASADSAGPATAQASRAAGGPPSRSDDS
ncbi:MAG TPA: rhodanese-like domain-containing protein [Pseudomonadales bacterium]|nr:rhodanese-like domain-containing protein [Pseudomonadales bacterium]